jgi:hypothetical protein
VVGGLTAALVVGALKQLLVGREKIGCRYALLSHQAGFSLVVGFKRAVGADVSDAGGLAQVAANQDGAVALEGVFFGAHEGQAKPRDTLNNAPQAGLEGWGIRNEIVTGNTVNVAVAFGAAGTEFIPEEKIADAGGAKGSLERLTVELWEPGAVRAAADINQNLDTMQPEQLEEILQGVVRVADGKELGLHDSNVVAQIL